VLFICVENSCRSQMAEAFARIHGGDSIDAASAGSNPSGQVNPKAIASMAERGYDLSAHASKSIDDVSAPFDVVVSMGCGDACPSVPATQRIEWNIPDPKAMAPAEFNEVRDLIEGEVKGLLSRLTS
jgi:protein-tyrosine-phosphatase